MKRRIGIVLMVISVALPVMTAAMAYLDIPHKVFVQALILFLGGAAIYIFANDKNKEQKQRCKQ